MTVAELIIELQAMPQEMQVFRDDYRSRAVPLRGVVEIIDSGRGFWPDNAYPRGVRIR